MWDTCTSHFGPKKFDRVGRGGQGRSKYCQIWASFWASEPSKAPKWVQDPRNGPQMIPPIAPDWFESISGTRKLLRLYHGLGRCVEAVFDWKWDPTSIEWKLHLFHFAWLVPHLNHFLYMPACQKRPETLKNGCCWLLLAQNAKFQPNLGFLGAESQKKISHVSI